ncbi:hTAFII28-like protein conserved region-domain-containing protein [Dendryphion nanum]|uniref:HTAFII28-like protein conserved region-domain-containing protein n=1 Tax=Dendryphion nanum TaxID=256645 RepID=A0A9P9EEJ7_9PLEO|nr:hTAFII28-like protein conserved region-domain-containing protein [Dendryphion nanum]
MASPPHIPQLNIPRKRSSIGSAAGIAKKRKPSQLRNSYAPEHEGVGSPLRYSRSPSVDSVATTSVVNGGGGRKRKKKDGDTASMTGSMRGAKGRADGRSTTGVEGEDADGGEAGEEEDDDDVEDGMDAVLEGGKATEATKKQEKEHERILMDAMDSNQSDRYATYRRIRLKREIVRKLVNQTLSQSVPPTVIITVTSYSKSFIGELVDRALTVRDEWAAARTHIPNPNLPPVLLQQGFSGPHNHRPLAKPSLQDLQNAGLYKHQVDPTEGYWKEVAADTPLQDRLKEMDKGPLTPAHIREALRRYKRDREGGGAGFAGMSLEGVERTMARTGGRRLFR